MPKTILNTQLVTNIICPEGKRKETYFDTATKGLCLEVRISGGKTYFLRYTDERGKTRYTKLADARDVSLPQARKLCDRTRNEIAMGVDPLDSKATKRAVPTFESFVKEQYMPFVQTNKRSWKTDETLFRTHMIPFFGKKRLDEITTADVLRFQQKGIQDGAAPGSVNRRLIMLRYMFNLATRDWKIPGVTKNPTEGIRLLQENNKKERYIKPEEMAKLYASVKASTNIMLPYIVAFLVLTGARKNEVLHATWDDFDLDRGDWRIPTTKSGNARHIPLNDGALRILEMVRGVSRSEFVFGNPKTKSPYQKLFYAWDVARKRAGLPDVRLHDLRHTFASMLINNGRNLYEVQKLLGHTQVKTTQRYAHLARETLVEASNVGSMSMAPALGLHPPVVCYEGTSLGST